MNSNLISILFCNQNATVPDPIPAVWIIKDVATAVSGLIFMIINRKGIHRIPPPIPTVEATRAIKIPAGKDSQLSSMAFTLHGVKTEISDHLVQHG